MADNKIILKKSNVSGKRPLSSDLEVGELALNMADANLFFKDPNDEVRALTYNDSSFSLVDDPNPTLGGDLNVSEFSITATPDSGSATLNTRLNNFFIDGREFVAEGGGHTSLELKGSDTNSDRIAQLTAVGDNDLWAGTLSFKENALSIEHPSSIDLIFWGNGYRPIFASMDHEGRGETLLLNGQIFPNEAGTDGQILVIRDNELVYEDITGGSGSSGVKVNIIDNEPEDPPPYGIVIGDSALGGSSAGSVVIGHGSEIINLDENEDGIGLNIGRLNAIEMVEDARVIAIGSENFATNDAIVIGNWITNRGEGCIVMGNFASCGNNAVSNVVIGNSEVQDNSWNNFVLGHYNQVTEYGGGSIIIGQGFGEINTKTTMIGDGFGQDYIHYQDGRLSCVGSENRIGVPFFDADFPLDESGRSGDLFYDNVAKQLMLHDGTSYSAVGGGGSVSFQEIGGVSYAVSVDTVPFGSTFTINCAETNFHTIAVINKTLDFTDVPTGAYTLKLLYVAGQTVLNLDNFNISWQNGVVPTLTPDADLVTLTTFDQGGTWLGVAELGFVFA